jgi:hypothetical protein
MDVKTYIKSYSTCKCTLQEDYHWTKDLDKALDEEGRYVVRLYGLEGRGNGVVLTIISRAPPFI